MLNNRLIQKPHNKAVCAVFYVFAECISKEND